MGLPSVYGRMLGSHLWSIPNPISFSGFSVWSFDKFSFRTWSQFLRIRTFCIIYLQFKRWTWSSQFHLGKDSQRTKFVGPISLWVNTPWSQVSSFSQSRKQLNLNFLPIWISIKGFGNMYGGSKFQTRLVAYSGELVKNALPVKTNLVRRNVLAEDICEHCKQVPEDMIYAIWLCSGVSGVWKSDLAWDFRYTKSFPKFLDLVQFIIDEGKDLAQFAMFIQTLVS